MLSRQQTKNQCFQSFSRAAPGERVRPPVPRVGAPAQDRYKNYEVLELAKAA